MDHTLKDYQEECVDEGTWQPDPATEVGEWEEHDLNVMDAKMNDMFLPVSSPPLHPSSQPPDGIWKFKVQVSPRELFMYLFEDTRDIILQKLKEDTHPQVRAKLQQGSLKCKCGWTPR